MDSERMEPAATETDRVAIRVLFAVEAVYGRTPFSLLKSDAGSLIVEELLVQIGEGMFV